jgi:hypothetical protein
LVYRQKYSRKSSAILLTVKIILSDPENSDSDDSIIDITEEVLRTRAQLVEIPEELIMTVGKKRVRETGDLEAAKRHKVVDLTGSGGAISTPAPSKIPVCALCNFPEG